MSSHMTGDMERLPLTTLHSMTRLACLPCIQSEVSWEPVWEPGRNFFCCQSTLAWDWQFFCLPQTGVWAVWGYQGFVLFLQVNGRCRVGWELEDSLVSIGGLKGQVGGVGTLLFAFPVWCCGQARPLAQERRRLPWCRDILSSCSLDSLLGLIWQAHVFSLEADSTPLI